MSDIARKKGLVTSKAGNVLQVKIDGSEQPIPVLDCAGAIAGNKVIVDISNGEALAVAVIGGNTLAAHPVGSRYISDNPTSPAALFGGTWVQEKDRVIIGAGNLYAVGATGGEVNHLLTAAESGLPSHAHAFRDYWSVNGGGAHPTGACDDTANYRGATANQGGWNASVAHNNMMPWLAAYIWRRTA